jgi:hypothetical protein
MIIKKHGDSKVKPNELGHTIDSVKKLKDKSLGKILNQISG